MPDPSIHPDDHAEPGVATRRWSKARRTPRSRALRVTAIALVLLFIAAQLAGGARHQASARTGPSAHGKSHLDEARGHLDAILHLFG